MNIKQQVVFEKQSKKSQIPDMPLDPRHELTRD